MSPSRAVGRQDVLHASPEGGRAPPEGDAVMRAAFLPATPASGGFDALASEAAAEGHRFVARLADEWRSGANRFDRPGEALRGVFGDGVLLAVGGLNADPYLPDDSGTARLRHVYVRPAWRRAGWGAVLTRHLLSLAAASRFRRVRLRTANPEAARLYERFGFERVAEPSATHALALMECPGACHGGGPVPPRVRLARADRAPVPPPRGAGGTALGRDRASAPPRATAAGTGRPPAPSGGGDVRRAGGRGPERFRAARIRSARPVPLFLRPSSRA